METHPLLTALSSVSTSNQWSVLDSLLPKVNKKLDKSNHPEASSKDLRELLHDFDEHMLELYGVWKHGFSKGMIVCTNPAFARACQARDFCLSTDCLCGAGKGHRNTTGAEQRYFGSHDYNGGRHACTQSKHVATCPLWRPAPTSHLHSWRRGFEEDGGGRGGEEGKQRDRGRGGRGAEKRVSNTKTARVEACIPPPAPGGGGKSEGAKKEECM